MEDDSNRVEDPMAEAGSLLHLLLLLLHQPAVVRQDLAVGQVERHLQGHQDSKLKRYQLPPADPEALLQLLWRTRTKFLMRERHMFFSLKNGSLSDDVIRQNHCVCFNCLTI